MSKTPEDVPFETAAVCYFRKINPRCGYCGAPATAIRISIVPPFFEAYVMTACEEHAHGEMEHAISQGMVPREPGSGDLIDPQIYSWFSQAIADAESQEVAEAETKPS